MSNESLSFNPANDIPPLDGKVILVTGGNNGLGKQCVLEYARHNPSQIWLAARNLDKARAALQEIQQEVPNAAPIKLLELDLSSAESVRKAASQFSAESERLDILMLNAGIMASAPGKTRDGYELQFGTNYVGHALLAKLLLPVLEKTAGEPSADVRIIMVSSRGYQLAPKPEGIQFDSLKTEAEAMGPYTRYGQSKLAQIFWAREMAERYPQFTVTSIHPGVVRTNLASSATGSWLIVRMLFKVVSKVLTPVDQGVKNQLWASVAKEVKSGEYYEPVGVAGAGVAPSNDLALGKKLWDWTEEELEAHSA